MFLNSNFNLFLGLVKPLLNSELLSRVHLHRSDMDYEAFYRDHIPKTHLPKEYGGDLESVEVLHQKHCEKLKSLKNYFIYEKMQTNFEFDPFMKEYFDEINSV